MAGNRKTSQGYETDRLPGIRSKQGKRTISLARAGMQDAESICGMQLEAFEELLERYQDFDVSPGNTQD